MKPEVVSLMERMRVAADAATQGQWSVAQPLSAEIKSDHIVDFGISPPSDPFAVVRAGGLVCHAEKRKISLANASYIALCNPANIKLLLGAVAESEKFREMLTIGANMVPESTWLEVLAEYGELRAEERVQALRDVAEISRKYAAESNERGYFNLTREILDLIPATGKELQ